jgi:hypothetical protein
VSFLKFRVYHQSYKLLLKLAQRILYLLVQAWEDSLGLFDCLFLFMMVSLLFSINRRFCIGDMAHLLPQNKICILIICSLTSFELSDFGILLLELLVVADFLFDQTVEY